MIKFHKYQDIQNRLDIKECEGLLNGIVTIQPKLDGSNCQLWWDGEKIVVASRNRVLSEREDNHGCYAALHNDERYKEYFRKYPNHKLCGEWLIPNHIKYRSNAYNKFYVFDIIEVSGDEEEGHAHYLDYHLMTDILWVNNIDFVPHLLMTEEEFAQIMIDPFKPKNLGNVFPNFLMEYSEECTGEGIVVKNYGYKNPYGRSAWCKIINKAYYDAKGIKKEKKDRYDSSTEEVFVDENLSNHLFTKILHKMSIGTITEFQANIVDDFDKTRVKEFIMTSQVDFKKDFCIDVPMFDENDLYNADSVKRSLTCMRNIIAKRAVNFLRESNFIT